MKILAKKKDDVHIITENEDVHKGDYLEIIDEGRGSSLIVQVYDIEYFDVPGIEEDLLRDLLLEEMMHADTEPSYSSITQRVKNVRLVKCKVRGSINGGRLSQDVDWIPSRTYSRIRRLSGSDLLAYLNPGVIGEGIRVGRTPDGYPVELPPTAFDGSLTLILGKKGTGKSHLAKLLISGLAENGAHVLVFDINNEYVGLTRRKDGSPSPLARRVIVLEPGRTLKFNLRYLGREVVANIFKNVLGLPGVSLREFLRIWGYLERRNMLTLDALGEYISRWRTNEMVREALLSRFFALASSGLIVEGEERGFRFEDIIAEASSGAIIVVLLAGASPVTRKIVVEAMLSKLADLLRAGAIPPMFILAEEAHLYVRETYWEDLITRMRHYGAYTIFVTNQPDALKEYVYRQADNFFLFSYTNNRDIEHISRLSAIDSDTLEGIVPTLRRGRCLVLGKATNWMPLVVDVNDVPFESMGRTKLIFGNIRLTSNSK